MKTSSQKTEGLEESIFVVVILVMSTSKLDRLLEKSADETGRGLNASILRRNVNLQSILVVHCQFLAFVDRSSETAIVWSGVLIVGIVLKQNRLESCEI